MNGVLVVDKPRGWTSHDVVAKMRRIAGTRRIGHLGTLDPLATGVLPLLIDRATRLAQFFTRNDKVYEGVIRFGWSTNTYDADGEPNSPQVDVTLDESRLASAIARFRGLIRQTPPAVSAKKIQGKPAYVFARKNIAVELEPVEVTIFRFDLQSVEGPRARVLVHCSAGTYLRSIAHDLGQELGCGAFLEELRRTASGAFTLDHAKTIDEFAALSSEKRLDESVIPASRLLPDFPTEVVDQITETQIRQGRDFRVSPFRVRGEAKYVKAVSRGGELIAIGEVRLPNLYHPLMVL